MHLIVVLEPAIELGHHRGRIGPGIELDVVALEGLYEGLGDAIDPGVRTGVKHGTRPIA